LSQLISIASSYGATEFDTKIPSLGDTANIVEAFKLYHYGLDNYNGDVSPAATSIHGHLVDFNDRVTTLEANPNITISGTTSEVTVSGGSGAFTIGLPDDVTIGDDLIVTDTLSVGGSASILGRLDITGNLQVSGNLSVSGSTTFVNTQSVSVTDPVILLATNNSGDTLDIGLVGKYLSSGSTLYTGFVRDDADKVWKLVSSLSASPTTTVNFTGATFDSIKLGSIESIGTITANNFVVTGTSDIRYQTSSQTGSYTAILADAGKIIEMSVASANNLTIPPDSTSNFGVGSQITILQTGTGQTTIVEGSGVTVNGSPGLKLRAQWSSATLIKRSANNWVALGDLVA
jgi:hypothetical protein